MQPLIPPAKPGGRPRTVDMREIINTMRTEVRTPPAPSPAPTPSAARRASQAGQTTAQGGERGYEGGKKIKGRTRHIRVDVWGLWLVVFVSRAALDDAVAAPHVLKHGALAASPRLAGLGAASQEHQHGLNEWSATASPGPWRLEVVRRPAGSQGCVLVPKRGVVERTRAWLGRCRRHSKDDARRTDASESMLRISAMPLLRKRLTPSKVYRPFRYRDAA